MEYSFRPNLFQKHRCFRIAKDRLESLGPDGRLLDSYDLRDLRAIQKYEVGRWQDSGGNKFSLQQCKLKFGLKTVLVKSASWSGANQGVDHRPDYELFLRLLCGKLATYNPEAKVTSGGFSLVLAFWIFVIMGILTTLAGLAMLIYPLVTGEPIWESLWIALIAILCGIPTATVSYSLSQTHWPKTESIT